MGSGIRISRSSARKEIPRIIENCFTYFMILSPYLLTLVFYFFCYIATRYDTGASSLYCIQTKEAAYYFSVRNFVLYYSVFTFTISILYHVSRLFDLAFVNFSLTSGVLPLHIRHPVGSKDIPAGFRIKSGTFHPHPDSPCSNSIHNLRHIHN